MATKKVTKTEAKVETKVKLNPIVWDVPYNADLVAQVLLVMRSNKRQGNAHAKTRADVSGGGKKPWKQKGTGRARAGSNRSPLWAKGGVTFVPNNRNWEQKVNRKMRKLALAVLLSEKLREKALDFANIKESGTLSEIRKSVMKEVLVGKHTLIVSGNENVAKALGNVEKVAIIKPEDLNAMNLSLAKKVIVENSAVNVIEKKYTDGK